MSSGPLSPLMLTAAAGFLPDAATISGIGNSLDISADLQMVLDDFNNLSITTQFQSIVTSATGVLGATVLADLQTLGASTFPALTNSIPTDYAADLSVIAPGGVFDGGLTGLVDSMAVNIMGAGDLSRFAQIYSTADGAAGQANQFINSNNNIDAIGNTYNLSTGGMDSVITASVNQVSESFGAFGGDLQNLGHLINLQDINNLGDPFSLLRQFVNVGGLTPTVNNLVASLNINTSSGYSEKFGGLRQIDIGIADSVNKALYEGMTKITGNDLDQIKAVFSVVTPGIETMADLLNPVKIFPNSFATLTMPTPDGLREIYIDSKGTVNSNLEIYFLDNEKTVAPIDERAITRARLEIYEDLNTERLSGLIDYQTFKGENLTPAKFPTVPKSIFNPTIRS